MSDRRPIDEIVAEGMQRLVGEGKYTEQDLVRAQREAFAAGHQYSGLGFARSTVECVRWEARRRYPLPKVKRQRVLEDPHATGSFWRYDDAAGVGAAALQITHDRASGTWWTPAGDSHLMKPTRQRVAMWWALIEQPYEEVEPENTNAPLDGGASEAHVHKTYTEPKTPETSLRTSSTTEGR